MESLTSICCRKIINKQLPVECLEKLVEKAVVYVPIQTIKSKRSNKILETYFLGGVYSSREKAEQAIPKDMKDSFLISKHNLNPLFPITHVYVFDTEGFTFVTNDIDYFREMYDLYKKINICHDRDDFELFRHEVDEVKTLQPL